MFAKSSEKSGTRQKSVPGAVPEAPGADFLHQIQNLENSAADTTSVSALSLSSLGSVLNAVSAQPKSPNQPNRVQVQVQPAYQLPSASAVSAQRKSIAQSNHVKLQVQPAHQLPSASSNSQQLYHSQATYSSALASASNSSISHDATRNPNTKTRDSASKTGDSARYQEEQSQLLERRTEAKRNHIESRRQNEEKRERGYEAQRRADTEAWRNICVESNANFEIAELNRRKEKHGKEEKERQERQEMIDREIQKQREMEEVHSSGDEEVLYKGYDATKDVLLTPTLYRRQVKYKGYDATNDVLLTPTLYRRQKLANLSKGEHSVKLNTETCTAINPTIPGGKPSNVASDSKHACAKSGTTAPSCDLGPGPSQAISKRPRKQSLKLEPKHLEIEHHFAIPQKGLPSSQDLVVVNGRNVNLKCFLKGQHLSDETFEACLDVMGDKLRKKMEETKKGIITNQLVYKVATRKVRITEDGLATSTSSEGWRVRDDAALLCNMDDHIQLGVVREDKKYFSYVLDHRLKELCVFCTRPTEDFQQGINLLADVMPEKYDVKYIKEEFAEKKDEDSGVAALYELEKFVRQRQLTGVETLKEYRQKLKWMLLDSADDAPVASTSRKECTSVLEAIHESVLQEISSAKNWEEIFNAAPELKRIGNLITCDKCPTKHGLTETTKDSFHSMKAKIKKHFQSKDHVKASGIASLSPPEKVRGKVKDVAGLVVENPMMAVSEDGKKIYCIPCKPVNRGCYTLAAGTNTTGEALTRVKKEIKAHLETASHAAAESGSSSIQDFEAGLVAARNVLSSVMAGKGYQDFQKRMASDSAKNVRIGDINHSADFAASLTSHMAAATMDAFKIQVHEPLPGTGMLPHLSVGADKVTVNNTSYHLVVQVMPHAGEMRSYVLDIVKSTSGTGEALAADIGEGLEHLYTKEEAQEVLTGGCFDGVYFHCHVPDKLMDALEIPEEKREGLTWIHDPAHRLELAAKDSRKKTQDDLDDGDATPWIQENFDVHSAITAKFRKSPKAMEALRSIRNSLVEAGEDIESLKRFKKTCATRFSAHLAKSHSATFDNYEVLFKYFENTQDADIQPLLTADFCASMCVLKDIYGIVADSSVKLQKVHCTPWSKSKVFRDLVDDLKSIEAALSAKDFRPTSNKLQNFNAFSSELIAFRTFKDQPVKGVARGRTRGQSSASKDRTPNEVIAGSCEQALEYVQNLRSKVESRTANEENKTGWAIVHSTEKCLSFNGIRSTVTEEELEDLHQRALHAGFISQCDFSTFVSEYIEYVDEVEQARAATENLNEATFIVERLTTATSTTPNLNRVLSAVVSKNTVETVCESIGSRMKIILAGRPNLSVEQLKAEIILWHQGPNPNAPEESNALLKEALNRQFKGNHWRFHRSGDKRHLKHHKVSQVVDKEIVPKSKINFQLLQ